MQSFHPPRSLKSLGILSVTVRNPGEFADEEVQPAPATDAFVGSIVLADSDPKHAFYVECLLRRLAPAYDIVVVSNGAEAIDYLTVSVLRCDTPAAVLLGDALTGHGSIEVLAWARGHPAFDEVGFLLFGPNGGSPDPRHNEKDVVAQDRLVSALRPFLQRHCSEE